MTDNQELCHQLHLTMTALAHKWGVGTETPFGIVTVATHDRTAWRRGHRDISIHNYQHNRYWAKKDRGIHAASTDDLLQLSKTLAAMAQFFASGDFQKRLQGSVGLLKRLNKALAG